MCRNRIRWLVLSYLLIAALSAGLAVVASTADADSGQVLDLQIVESMHRAWR